MKTECGGRGGGNGDNRVSLLAEPRKFKSGIRAVRKMERAMGIEPT